MQVLIPQQLKILNDTVPENEAPLWDKAVAYTKGQSVIYDHYVYKAVDAAAAGVVPVDNCDADGVPWRTISVTNKYACLDIYNWTQTKADGAPDSHNTSPVYAACNRSCSAQYASDACDCGDR